MNPHLTDRVIHSLRDGLLAARQSVLSGLGIAEDDLAAMLEVAEPELEERSQEEAASDVATRVAGLRFDELRAIQGALTRIANGSYGVCVQCGSDIAIERLRAVAATPICGVCAAASAPAPNVRGAARERGPSAPVPEELVGLSDAEIAAIVREKLHDEVGEAIGPLRVLCRHGLIGLDGEVASDELRQIVLRIIEEEIGLETEDRMRVSGFARESVGAGGEGEAVAAEPGVATADLFETAEEGTDYVAPDTPPAKVE